MGKQGRRSCPLELSIALSIEIDELTHYRFNLSLPVIEALYLTNYGLKDLIQSPSWLGLWGSESEVALWSMFSLIYELYPSPELL